MIYDPETGNYVQVEGGNPRPALIIDLTTNLSHMGLLLLSKPYLADYTFLGLAAIVVMNMVFTLSAFGKAWQMRSLSGCSSAYLTFYVFFRLSCHAVGFVGGIACLFMAVWPSLWRLTKPGDTQTPQSSKDSERTIPSFILLIASLVYLCLSTLGYLTSKPFSKELAKKSLFQHTIA